MRIQPEATKKVIIVMGVSGSGKTSVGQRLANELSVPFIDADDHHPQANIEKMSRGIPLSDHDRTPWLDILNKIAIEHAIGGCVIACSALKEVYRKQLIQSIASDVQWIYLKGSYDQIFDRMKSRKGHFMDVGMLRSQFEILEQPQKAISVDIVDSPAVIVKKIKAQLE